MFQSVPPPKISASDESDAGETEAVAVADPPAPSSRGRMGCAAVFVLVFLILALLAGFIFYRAERMAEKGASGLVNWGGRVRDAVADLTGMQPRVTVNEQVVFEQAQSVLELAVLERDATVERETQASWMGSTKHLRVRGLYHVKVGYRLNNDFNVNVVGSNAEVVRLQLPSPRVLTVELKNLEVLTMDNGLWNHLSKDEIATEVNTLGLEAHLKATQNGTPAEAQRMFIERLQEKLGPGHRVEIVPLTPSPSPSPNATVPALK